MKSLPPTLVFVVVNQHLVVRSLIFKACCFSWSLLCLPAILFQTPGQKTHRCSINYLFFWLTVEKALNMWCLRPVAWSFHLNELAVFNSESTCSIHLLKYAVNLNRLFCCHHSHLCMLWAYLFGPVSYAFWESIHAEKEPIMCNFCF